MICSMFGHRDCSDDIYLYLRRAMEILIEDFGVTCFYIGYNGNFDKIAYYTLSELVKEYEHVKFRVVAAYMPRSLSLALKENSLLITYPEGFEDIPKSVAIPRRNRWMVEQSDFVLGYVKFPFGGAATAFDYAKKKKKQCFNLASPDTDTQFGKAWHDDFEVTEIIDAVVELQRSPLNKEEREYYLNLFPIDKNE